jgi:hypothetical protein
LRISGSSQSKGSSVYKELLKLYVDNGFYKEHLVSLTKKRNGRIARNQMMIDMRENPLKEINGQRVIMSKIINYRKNLLDGSESEMVIPKMC